jgi:hypothetical protein
MTFTADIRDALVRFLDGEVEVEVVGERVAVLTPAEYPDGDGVVVWVSDRSDGRYEVTDLGTADARLVTSGPGAKALGPAAAEICRRFGVYFEGGVIVTRVERDGVAVACWRVAQTAAALAEAQTFHRKQQPKEATFVDAVTRELRRHDLAVHNEVELLGASKHPYVASVYLPATETIIEPISGEQAWNKARAVYVEFGDLTSLNGYTALAVLGDMEGEAAQSVEDLLRQVGLVAHWEDRSRWMETISQQKLI